MSKLNKMYAYTCHHGSQYEGGSVKALFQSEKSAVDYVEKWVAKINKENKKINSEPPDEHGFKFEFSMWEKIVDPDYLHMWIDDTELWIIEKEEVLP